MEIHGSTFHIPKEVRVALLPIVVILIGIGVWVYGQSFLMDQAIDQTTYQIVTLNDGRSYFGKLKGLGREYVHLRGTFFLKVSAPEFSPEGEEEPSSEEPFALQRMGTQLYGPEEDVYIHESQIVSWQNLREDSPVVTAIEEYQNTKASDKKDSNKN